MGTSSDLDGEGLKISSYLVSKKDDLAGFGPLIQKLIATTRGPANPRLPPRQTWSNAHELSYCTVDFIMR